jgi:hypothetical protein
MSSFEELNALPTEELHDRATKHARHHLNVKFFWSLIEMTPAAMTRSGDVEEGERDIAHWSGQVADAVQDKPELKDAMRPAYIDYLLKHPGA